FKVSEETQVKLIGNLNFDGPISSYTQIALTHRFTDAFQVETGFDVLTGDLRSFWGRWGSNDRFFLVMPYVFCGASNVTRLAGRRGVWGVVLLVFLTFGSAGDARGQSASEIMRKQRELHRLNDEEEVQVLRLVSKSGAIKERKLVLYTFADPDDLRKSLIRFLAPRDVENTALLTWEAKDGNDDQWLYLPAIRKAKRIAASSTKNQFMGTDFACEDLRPENVGVHRYTAVGSEAIDGRDCVVIEAVPATERQAADSGYSKRRLWIDQDTLVALKREYYDK